MAIIRLSCSETKPAPTITPTGLVGKDKFFKGGIDLNSPLERGSGVCFLLGKLLNHYSTF